MQINGTANINFGSKNCPIKPFTVQTKRGPLVIEELQDKDSWKAAKFAVDCTIESIPPYTYGNNIDPISRSIQVLLFKLSDAITLRKKDGNSTILVAKDAENKIQAFLSMSSLYKIPKIPKEECEKIGYGNDILISRDYRNMGVGQVLSDKVFEAAKGHFTDIIAHGNYGAINFHERNGFKPIDMSNPIIKKIASYIGDSGNENCILMSKSLDSENPCWQRLAKYV